MEVGGPSEALGDKPSRVVMCVPPLPPSVTRVSSAASLAAHQITIAFTSQLAQMRYFKEKASISRGSWGSPSRDARQGEEAEAVFDATPDPCSEDGTVRRVVHLPIRAWRRHAPVTP
jgi:hypothetical protein